MNDDYLDFNDQDSDIGDCLTSSDDEGDLLFIVKDGKDVLRCTNEDSEVTLNTNVSNENLLYDPNIDKDNENWMKRKRTYGKQDESNSNANKVSTSDAMLSCPACLTTVCVDCQRHDVYKHQFRAMFVMNCRIDLNQYLRYENKNISKKRRKKYGPGKLIPCEQSIASFRDSVEIIYTEDKNENQSSTNKLNISDKLSEQYKREEVYNPVKCDICATEIAVYDSQEVYHFFNVIESIA
ncbi:E2F-associated phosphoprotein isoform X2 [Hydra vulgaris]|uniref:E2F-associated phosphoprotein isoform X2 n=1 Tax=Hydra vulgaris TaxID=6087 RepID=A0ABM4BHI4_HYDVU